MQPIRLTIPGRYWDSQIYSGRLYLFLIDGSIQVIDWDRLVDQFPIEDDLRLALSCAFSRSDYLYGARWNLLFRDHEVKELIRSKFDRLSDRNLEIQTRQLRHDFLVAESENRFAFPHTDSRIYGNMMYVSSQQGIWQGSCNKRLVYGVNQRPTKHWDAPVLAMAAYGNTLAMAGGCEGLFETPIGDTSWKYSGNLDTDIWEIRKLADRDCVKCDWAFTSIFASSHVDDGFLAHFIVDSLEQPPRDGSAWEEEVRTRRFDCLREAREIFDCRGYAWASQDKIYQAGQGTIRVCRFDPWAEDQGSVIESLGEISLQAWKGGVVSAGVAVFGSVIECDNALVVTGSDGVNDTIPGEPVRWRVFPRSRFYENHLHVIYEDRLEIWSYNHDYFVDQKEKRMGVKPYLGHRRW